MALLFVGCLAAGAATVGPTGCPQFHCTPEATGVMVQPIVTPLGSGVSKNYGLGQLAAQGCSGDGTRLACLFVADGVASGPTAGTLKILNAANLQAVWGDKGVAGSYVLGTGVSIGQVPFLFADGTIGAGDSSGYALYGANGVVQKYTNGRPKIIALGGGRGADMGLTPVASNRAIITQSNGKLTLIDSDAWTVLSTLTLVDPTGGGGNLAVSSPSAGSDGVLYVVASVAASNAGYLFAIGLQGPPASPTLVLRATFSYDGVTGASPVVVKPDASGLPAGQNLVLLHVPGLSGDGTKRLLGLVDGGGPAFSTMPLWPAAGIPLDEDLIVAPTIDEYGQTLYFQYGNVNGDDQVYAYDIVHGTPRPASPYNIQALGGLPVNLTLNGHMGAIQTATAQAPGTFTLLLSGASRPMRNFSGAQYMIAFQPATNAISVRQIDSQPAQGTAAWNLSASPNPQTPNQYCPVVVTVINATSSGITRVCN